MITPPCQAGRVRHNARSVSVSRDRGKRRKKKEARKREREKKKKKKKLWDYPLGRRGRFSVYAQVMNTNT